MERGSVTPIDTSRNSRELPGANLGVLRGHNDALVYVKPSIKVAMREQHKAARA